MFVDARQILGLAEWDLAQRLGTGVATIRALETGQLSALPSWPETSRVVTAYLTGLGLDARPVLHSLAHDLATLAATAPPVPARTTPAFETTPRGEPRPPVAPATAGPRGSSRGSERVAPAKGASPAWVTRLGRTPKAFNSAVGKATRSAAAVGRRAARRAVGGAGGRGDHGSGRSKGRRAAIAASGLAVLIAAVAQTSFAGSMMAAAAVPLPATLTRVVGRVTDMIRVQLAPMRDGLRWIEVDDPRSRRGDKLQTARR